VADRGVLFLERAKQEEAEGKGGHNVSMRRLEGELFVHDGSTWSERVRERGFVAGRWRRMDKKGVSSKAGWDNPGKDGEATGRLVVGRDSERRRRPRNIPQRRAATASSLARARFLGRWHRSVRCVVTAAAAACLWEAGVPPEPASGGGCMPSRRRQSRARGGCWGSARSAAAGAGELTKSAGVGQKELSGVDETQHCRRRRRRRPRPGRRPSRA
jgi:hypothetical protein